MNTVLLSSISLILLISFTGFLFYKLKNIGLYSVAIYLFLISFWVIVSFLRKVSSKSETQDIPYWVWPLVTAGYQFVQVVTRIPLGKLSQRMRSRQYPILIATTSVLVSGIVVISSDFALWAIIFATLSTGIFGATFGMQNQYYSENYNIRAVFMTIALISIIPSMGALSSTLFVSLIEQNSGDVIGSLRWSLLGFIVALAMIMIGYYFFKERRETIVLDNQSEENKILSKMSFKEIFTLSTTVVFLSIGYNLVTTSSSHGHISGITSFSSTLLTVVSIVLALLVSIVFIRKINSFHLTMIGQIILVAGFAFGVLHIFVIKQDWSKWIYLFVVTIGFAIYQNTMMGVALHFDHKNHLLVLGIWLTVRSLSTGTGELIRESISHLDDHAIKWLLVVSLSLVVVSIPYSLFFKKKYHKEIFNVVDKWERNNYSKIL